ncbi:FAD/NAD(P)-binding protein [Vallicoccus soli]|uniref:Lycopene cyclase n=1 Tax=Vallicoccus soli TaxID=2339232 RepID=A0A3A3Z920_9ACTN|nr:FAD/NAD(P)-binding protein [Vallicoccus soli]RJK97566.1 lycopene cyclase [Vallicoccus soli]
MAVVRRGGRPLVVVAGAGAAGTLVALHLCRAAARRGQGLDLVLADPADRWGRGTAFGTADDRHLLNVPASGMTALPEEPGDFVAWRTRHGDGVRDPYSFAPRRQFALYLDDRLREALAAASGAVSLRHLRQELVAVDRTGRGVAVTAQDGSALEADALVVATGLPAPGTGWAPEALARSAFLVPDPWAPGALDVVARDRSGPPDVLLVGTGLTMVDVVLSLSGHRARAGRRLLALSRSGRPPRPHAPAPRLAAIPDVADWPADLPGLRDAVRRHLADVARSTGDWRPGVDGLRFRLAELWQRLGEDERRELLAHDAGPWGVLRHRMPPSSARLLGALRACGALHVSAGRVTGAEPLPGGGLRVGLGAAGPVDVGWVVNCTGPATDVRTLGNRLLDDLLRPRGGGPLALPATAGMGLRTVDGRLVTGAGEADAPVWALGALRRGELWESTAVPEIRAQALALATGVLDAVAPLPRRLADGRLVGGHHPLARPRDPLGLPVSTTAEAAAAYAAGLERVMRLQDGAEGLLRHATRTDPGFALAHAALALLGHEAGADADVAASLEAARRAVRERGDDRERSLVEVVRLRVRDPRGAGAAALVEHVARYPRDVLAVSAAVPTIAFSGLVDVRQDAWDLLEGLAPAYGDHWWFISLLAFTRQDQGRYEEAGLLAESALSCEPSSGHAVHAQAHVLYETGRHEEGRAWLDHWVRQSGRSASHRAHFSWHAALHELALGDVEAVRRRYAVELAPPAVTGVRALVDAASLLWRWQLVADDGTGAPDVREVLAAVGPDLLARPRTPFTALHAAMGLAAAHDGGALRDLRRHCRAARDPLLRTTVADVCEALLALVEERWAEAAGLLTELLPVLHRVGGSAAQREALQEALLLCLARSGRGRDAARLLADRLACRPSPADDRRLLALAAAPQRA